MPDKIHLDYAEFYITNVCNLNCTHCNRYNNYNFKGWQSWDDYADTYARWAEKVSIKHIVILGGEPLLNPEIIKWSLGLYDLFHGDSDNIMGVDIVTNGYHINKVKGLYDAVKSGKIFLSISLHNPGEKEFIFNEIRKFVGPGHEIKSVDSDSHQWAVRDKLLKISITEQLTFTTSSVIPAANGRLTLHKSDPIKAHQVCGFAQNKSYHFIKGKFYKCGPVAILPEFDQQFHLDVSDDDRKLMNAYQPLTVDDFDNRSEDFFKNLDQAIPQCRLCPESLDWKPLLALPKSGQRSMLNIRQGIQDGQRTNTT